MRTHQKLAALAAGAILTLVGPAAFADTVYNDLDNSIDSTLETLNLTYDSVAQTGATGTTTLAIQVNGHPDHPGCNIQGGAHYISLNAVVANPAVASVSLANGGTFNACTDTVLATVQALGLGSTAVTFVIDADRTSNDPHLEFRLDEAAFQVNVTEGTVQPPGGCDADPAAPAWSAAIMQKSGIKSGSKDWQSVQSKVAQAMGPGATFGGYAKNAHPQYENAVQAFVQASLPNKNIVSAQAAARPGWECASQ